MERAEDRNNQGRGKEGLYKLQPGNGREVAIVSFRTELTRASDARSLTRHLVDLKPNFLTSGAFIHQSAIRSRVKHHAVTFRLSSQISLNPEP